MCENGYFAWPLNYTNRPHNFSALILLVFVTLTYFASSFVSKFLLSLSFKNPRRVRTKPERQYRYSGLFALSLFATAILLFFNLFIVLVGAPAFAINKNIARAVFWESVNIPQAQRIISVYVPGMMTFLFLYLSRRKWLTAVFSLNVLLYILAMVLLSQKSNILFLITPLLMAFYYRFAKAFKVAALVKTIVVVGVLAFLFMGGIEYANLPRDGGLIFGQYREKSVSTGMLAFISRISLGQGEPFWGVFQKWIVDGSHRTLGVDGVGYYSQLVTTSSLFGRQSELQTSFEYWITKELTAAWFADVYNMVITYLGEGIVYFGIAGLFLNAAIAVVILGFTGYLVRYFAILKAYDKFVVTIIVFSAKVVEWLQMGNLFSFIKLTEWLYVAILFGFIALIANYLPHRRVTSGK